MDPQKRAQKRAFFEVFIFYVKTPFFSKKEGAFLALFAFWPKISIIN